jgi:hypothetical protein
VLVECAAFVDLVGTIPRDAVPGQLGGRDDREHLVERLEQDSLLVEERLGPLPAIASDPGVQHEIVIPAGDVDRVELDRAESIEHAHHARRFGRQQPRRGKQVVEREIAPRNVARELDRDGCAATQRVGGRHLPTIVVGDP